ncbi:MAG TPA: hypothetical protein VK150_08650 [Geothrix sp.]|nr:hypothetical protein [Geothrix sp.]
MRIVGVVLVLALGLAACDRPPLPKTGETVQGKEQVPPVTTGGQPPSEHAQGR